MTWRNDLSAWTRSETDRGPMWAFAGSLGILYEITPGSAGGRTGWIPRVILGTGASKGITPGGAELYESVVYPSPEKALSAVVTHNNGVQHKAGKRGRYFPSFKPEKKQVRIASRMGTRAEFAVGNWSPLTPTVERSVADAIERGRDVRRAARAAHRSKFAK